MVAEYHNQSKLRFWCQMVLPLVYDDSLSYMELLNKVVNYLNNCIQDVGNCETNIELLLDAFESLQDYVNEMVEDISPEIESVIDQMIENGDFTEILTDALNTVVAPEYDEETTYLQYEYVLYEGNLYRANTTTSGEFDPTKWTEKTIAQDLTVLERYVYGLTANDVPYDGTQTYDAGSTGKAIKDLAAEVDSLDAGDIAYNSSTTYNNATVGKELGDLKGALPDKLSLSLTDTSVIPNGTDYDTLTTSGNYICETASHAQTMTNAPTSQGHRLYVIQNLSSNRITQIALSNTDTTKLLLRTYTSSGWSSWTEPSYRVQSQLVTNVEEDTTATKSYSVGDFLAINANLYKVIASIANGGTISSSTNVAYTTVADELKSLNSFAGGLSGIKVASFALTSSSTKTFNIPNTSFGLFFSFGSLTSIQEIALYRTTNSGTITYSQALNASGLTITKTTNRLTIQNTSTNATQIVFLSFSNDTITQV